MNDTVKLPKGVKVYDQTGKALRGEIPAADCPEKYKAKVKKVKDSDATKLA